MNKMYMKNQALPPVAIAGICALILAGVLAVFNVWASAIPLALFVVVCLLAPFFPQAGFFLPVISRGNTGEKVVAITFDDGPDSATTLPLLQLLAEYNIKATFFVTGEKAVRHGAIIRKIIECGHDIGNHSYSHDPILMLRSSKKLFGEIKSTQDILIKFDIVPCAFRPPAGITNPKLGPVLHRLGLCCVTFSCRGFDGGNRYVKGLANKILKKVKPDDIIVLHDVQPKNETSVNLWLGEVELILSGLREKKIEVVPLAELIGKSLAISEDKEA